MTSAPEQPPQRMTAEEYLALLRSGERKYEYVDGFVYPLHGLAGAGFTHNRLAARTLARLAQQLADGPCEPVGSDQLLRYWSAVTRRYYLPDVQVLCDAVEDAPVVLVEVLSLSTWRTDLNEKLALYTTLPSLLDYLVIASDQPLIRHYARHADWQPATHTSGGIRLDCGGLTLDVEALYRDLSLEPRA